MRREHEDVGLSSRSGAETHQRQMNILMMMHRMDTPPAETPARAEDAPAPRFTSGALLRVRLICDTAALIAAVALAFGIRFGLGWFEVTEASPLVTRSHILAGAVWIAALVAAMTVNRLYDEDTLFPGGGEISRVVRAAVEASAVLATFVFLTQSFYVSRSWFALVLIGSVVFLGGSRLAIRKSLRSRRQRGNLRRPALLVSTDPESWDGWRIENETEFEVMAKVDPAAFEEFVRSGTSRSLQHAAVMIRARDLAPDAFWRTLVLAGQRQWSVYVHSSVRSVGRDRLTIRDIGGHTIVRIGPPTLRGRKAVAKRAFDLILGISAIVLLAPVLIAVATAVLVRSGRPVIFSQPRLGRDARVFTMYKFRTMTREAEAESTWTVRNDPRLTPIGRRLRRFDLDELPQLWNVLKGDMSLVGPRPEQPNYASEFAQEYEWYQFRHRIRPGITGWSQTRGLRGDTPIDPRIEADNWYIENWSASLDLRILARTVVASLREGSEQEVDPPPTHDGAP